MHSLSLSFIFFRVTLFHAQTYFSLGQQLSAVSSSLFLMLSLSLHSFYPPQSLSILYPPHSLCVLSIQFPSRLINLSLFTLFPHTRSICPLSIHLFVHYFSLFIFLRKAPYLALYSPHFSHWFHHLSSLISQPLNSFSLYSFLSCLFPFLYSLDFFNYSFHYFL